MCSFLLQGKAFCLQGGTEQHNLKLSQFQKEVTIVEGQEVSCFIYVYRIWIKKTGKEGLPNEFKS